MVEVENGLSHVDRAEVESFKPSDTIGDSPFTVRWVLDNLTASDDRFNSLGGFSKVANVKARDISQGKGFISRVYKVDIEFENAQDYSVILKVPGVESIMEVMERTSVDNKNNPEIHDEHIAIAHNREVKFYDEFAPHVDIPLAKIYKTVEWVVGQQHGAILMESFFGRAETIPISTGANVQQLLNVAKHVGTIHAYLLSIPPETWMGKYSNKMFESFSKSDFFGPMFDILKKQKPGMFDAAIEFLGKYRMNKKFMLYLMCDVYKDAGLPLILTHGDLWTNNILWKKRSDGSLSYEVAAIIDWQVLREGCMTYDVAEFMAVCADGEIRREYEDDVLQCYYDRIVEEMGNYGKKVDFGMDQLKMAYKANFIVQAMMTMAMAVFLFPDLKEDDPRPRIQNAQAEKLYLRAQLAAEEAMDYLKNISVEKLTVNA
ncbi:hypothetical protein QR680_014994 [Steinernema hermaphroditum]|uniref:CHK kinase-like domain-containing protein n=1 Tax=Steinernema hermaphroditum TaxID=289476 RepID=A0AA39M566_9BILA|nr:hypothetical protein QR680_014994 [Steinernema hermaphroditum]